MSSLASKSGFMPSNGAQLYYEITGSGNPVVLIHAGIADHSMWADQIEQFARHYQVIVYDQRGFGQSTLPAEPFSFYDDLYSLLRQLDIKKAALIGCSLGSATAIDMTLAHPEMVNGLIVIGPSLMGEEQPSLSPEETALFTQVDEAVEAKDYATANDLEVHIWVDGPGRKPENVNAAVRERIRKMNLQTFTQNDEGVTLQHLDPPAGTRLKDIQVPMLVIVGDQDISKIQTTANRLASDVLGARKVVMQDSAHVPSMEHPELFNQLALEFLAALPW